MERNVVIHCVCEQRIDQIEIIRVVLYPRVTSLSGTRVVIGAEDVSNISDEAIVASTLITMQTVVSFSRRD